MDTNLSTLTRFGIRCIVIGSEDNNSPKRATFAVNQNANYEGDEEILMSGDLHLIFCITDAS